MILKNKYYGITHFKFLDFYFIYKIWKILFCKRNIHLFDEVYSIDKHYLFCDACELEVHINTVNTNFVDAPNKVYCYKCKYFKKYTIEACVIHKFCFQNKNYNCIDFKKKNIFLNKFK